MSCATYCYYSRMRRFLAITCVFVGALLPSPAPSLHRLATSACATKFRCLPTTVRSGDRQWPGLSPGMLFLADLEAAYQSRRFEPAGPGSSSTYVRTPGARQARNDAETMREIQREGFSQLKNRPASVASPMHRMKRANSRPDSSWAWRIASASISTRPARTSRSMAKKPVLTAAAWPSTGAT